MTTSEWTWGTTKTHGLAVGDSFEYGGGDRSRPGRPEQATIVRADRQGVRADFADQPNCSLGGVATRYWARAACVCMTEDDGSIEIPSGSCPVHGYLIDSV